MRRKYPQVICHRTPEKLLFVFMDTDCQVSELVITVYNKPVLCSPLTFSACKKGVCIAVPRTILNPNNGISRYSQFFEGVNYVIQLDVDVDARLCNVAKSLIEIGGSNVDAAKSKKLLFLSRQLELLANKNYSMSDYCFAVEGFPRCRYRQLREVLVLPCERKIRAVISATDVKVVIEKMFLKVKNSQQKHCVLLVDEVKIRPSIVFSGGVLTGMAKNDPSSKASLLLGIMAKCLLSGPSIMV